MGTESMLLLFDDIWMKLMELAKKAARYHAQL
ncbi:pathogenicity island 2 effector protein SseD [Salmonella enterica subsp. enterica serovar Heidelberg str. 86-0255]|nr:pathogenicity island 2 effector protein SseD [Salmonella enterica subsp. enterica serovar Heidelberg str. 86-0255]KJU28320.1 pathogenicity island 2 effector protein SseD [Salmonella enterica subsp. enterica serovar Heidelberg str. 83-1068]